MNLAELFLSKTSGVAPRKRLFLLLIILSMWVIADPAAYSEMEYAIQAPLAPRSLLLDGCVVEGRVITVGERGHILLSDDDGKSWRQARVPTQATLTGVYFQNRKLGWAVGHDAVILRTQDWGENWSRVFYAPEEERPLLDVLFLDEQTGFAVGAYGFFLESKDGGLSWIARSISEDDFHLNKIVAAKGGRLYMAAEAGRIYASEDSGNTWQELPSPYRGSFFGILPLENDILLAFGLRGNLFRSHDDGRSWEQVPVSTDAMLTDGLVLGNGNIVLVGFAGTLLISEDQGRSFHLRQQADRMAISAVVPAKAGRLILIGEFGAKRISMED